MKCKLPMLLPFLLNMLWAQPSAKEIIEKSDQLMRGKTMSGRYEMVVTTEEWERSMTFSFISEGTEKSFIRIEKPAKEKDVTFLKIGTEMWQFVPRINRVIKIPPSMMLRSWMGSDFTNDDLVKESSIVDDYSQKLVGETEIDGNKAYKVELIPKPDAPVVWGKILYYARLGDFVPIRQEFFNERDELVRTLNFSDIKKFDDRTIPAKMWVSIADKPNNKTTLLLLDAEFDKSIPGSTFTQQSLKRKN